MSREIKFRIWDDSPLKDGFKGIMINHEYAIQSDYLKDAINGKYSIMQFTGLKDKKGVEIYECDVVKRRFGDIVKVYFKEGSFIFGFSHECCARHCDMSDYEVIGNIHENPELL